MLIENIKEFTQRTKASKSTVYRFYKRNPELWSQTKIKGNKRFFPVTHEKYFDSELLYEENKMLTVENQSMRNVIDNLMDKDSLTTTLWFMDWHFLITVAYRLERNKKSCYKMMNGLYESLVEKHGEDAEVRMFFTTEAFANRNGYHNHLVLYCSDKKLHKELVADVQEYFASDRVDVKLYDKYKAGLFYTAKGGLMGDDWNILGNGFSAGQMAA